MRDREERRIVPACVALGIILVITVGLQQPASSVGLRWVPGPPKRTLRMIELEPLEMNGAMGTLRRDNSWLQWVALGIALLVLFGLLWFALRWLMQRRQARVARTAMKFGADTDVVIEADAQVLETGLAAAIAILTTTRDPGNAVIAAWQALEDAAALARLSRRPSETTTEFTARILYRSRRSAAPISELLTLSQRVRFGEHRPTAHDVNTASEALTVLVDLWRTDLPERRQTKGARQCLHRSRQCSAVAHCSCTSSAWSHCSPQHSPCGSSASTLPGQCRWLLC